MIYPELYDWQKQIVDHLVKKKSFGLFLDMGTGKTVQALAIAEQLNSSKILVVTKNAKACEKITTPGSWQMWSTKLGEGNFNIRCKTDSIDGLERRDNLVYIINYESIFTRTSTGKSGIPSLRPQLSSFIDLCRGERVTLILDESHSIKDPGALQTKALAYVKKMLTLVTPYLHTYLLSGTPFTTGFIDIYNQLKFMDCPLTKTKFKEDFCVLGHIKGLLGWQQPIIGYKNVDKLYDLIHEYAVTIKSEDVVKLPPQIFENHVVPTGKYFDMILQESIPKSELDSLNQARIKDGLPSLPKEYKPYEISSKRIVNPWFRNLSYPSTDYLADTPALLWMRARQLSIGFQGNADTAVWTDHRRIDAIKKFLEDNPGNYVLFYNYTPELVELFPMCESLDYKIDVYNGMFKSLYYYEKFAVQSPEERLVNQKNIILANFASGSTGMNWQLYNKCIISSLPLYKDWAQGLKRVHRVGSTETVEYHTFFADNWLDNGMMKSLREGVEYSQEMFNVGLNEIQIKSV